MNYMKKLIYSIIVIYNIDNNNHALFWMNLYSYTYIIFIKLEFYYAQLYN